MKLKTGIVNTMPTVDLCFPRNPLHCDCIPWTVFFAGLDSAEESNTHAMFQRWVVLTPLYSQKNSRNGGTLLPMFRMFYESQDLSAHRVFQILDGPVFSVFLVSLL